MAHNIWTIAKRGMHQIKEHGFGLLYWRYLYRHRILKQHPVECPPNSDVEVHMLICQRDWLNGIWTLHSFYFFSKVKFRLVLLHDGWMDVDVKVKEIYLKHFPGIITYQRSDLKQRVQKEITILSPTLAKLWLQDKYFNLTRFVDSFLLKRNRVVVYLDPDVLFFQNPSELLNGISQLHGKSGLWNQPRVQTHGDGTYCFRREDVVRLTGLQLPIPFQIGIGCFDTFTLDWQLLESVFSKLDIPENLILLVDQTIAGLIAAKYGALELPTDRYVIEPVDSLIGVTARHYYAKTRDLMYVEGIRHLSKVFLTNT